MKAVWVPHDIRDLIVDFVLYWGMKTNIPVSKFVRWLEIAPSKYYDWKRRYGKVNEHNNWIPRDNWLELWEKQAIINFHKQHPNDGYRRLTFMMLDANVVAVSPSSVYRVLKEAGLLQRWNRKPSKKGKGFDQPSKPHEHWHVDVTYINICSTFYYLCALLDGYSRYIVHWEIRESMTEPDIEVIIQRGREKFPEEKPRIISDNGPQFIAKDFKEFIRICGMTHVRTSPYYPQSNGKMERWNKSLKSESIRPNPPISLEDAMGTLATYVTHYNDHRLHSAIGYIPPYDKLVGNETLIFAERDRKLEGARQRRKLRRKADQAPEKREGVQSLYIDSLPLD